MKTLTIFTPTYNRAYCLHQCYESLVRQTSQDFIWLIIDDGSTDGTKVLVDSWMAEHKIDIQYHYQSNLGMHGAHNAAYRLIQTELNVCIDSDDFMPDDAVNSILVFWNNIAMEEQRKVAGIIGLDADKTGSIIGHDFPEALIKTTLYDLYETHKVKGDKKLVYRTDVIHKYPEYPIYEGERFVPLGYKYILIDQDFPLLTLNKVLCIVEYMADGSSLNIFHQYRRHPRGFAFSRISEIQYGKTFSYRFKKAMHYVANNLMFKNYNYFKDVPRKFTVLLATLPGIMLYSYILLKTKKNNMDLPIRILQVLTIMNRGGAETMIMSYYRNMDRTKVQFDFLLHRETKGAFDDEIEALGGTIFRMPAISPKNIVSYKNKLQLFFASHHYPIVHSHLNGLSYFVLNAAKVANVPFRIAHSHLAIEPIRLSSFFSAKQGLLFTIKDCVQNYLKKSVSKVTTHKFACGTSAGEWLYGKKAMDNVVIINNAIDSSKFIYDKDKAREVKQALGLTGKKTIGHVGRFSDQKNHVFLIEIFKKIYDKDPKAVLVLIGEGHLKQQIIEQVKNHRLLNVVHFLGVRSDIPELLQGMDVILFPSLYEGLPVALVEAQAAGLKILTSDTVTSKINITGLVSFKSLNDSANEWANEVLHLLDYKRKNMQEKIIGSNYDIKSNALDLQNFYTKLLNK